MARKWKPAVEEPTPARPYTAVIFDDPEAYIQGRRDLETIFGPSDYESPPLPTIGLESYYGIYTRDRIRFLSFLRQVGRDELADLRKKTVKVEMRHQHDGRPLILIDPGYVTEYTVVHTALEEDFQRIYLFHGIFGETIYYYENSTFQPFPHVPEFYHHRDVITVFNDLRLIHTST